MRKLNSFFSLLSSVLFILFFAPCYAQQDVEGLLIKLDSVQKTTDKLLLYKQVALHYQNQKAYLKAIDYLQKADDLQKSIDKNDRQEILKASVYNYTQVGKYKEAIKVGEELLGQNIRDTKQKMNIYNQLIYLAKQDGNYEQAIQYSKDLTSLLGNSKEDLDLMQIYNNLGVLYQEKGNAIEAMNIFQKAITLGLSLEKEAKEFNQKASVYLNLGTTFANLRDFQSAKYHFVQALGLWEKQKNAHKIAQVQNYLAANYYVSGNNTDAINYAQQASELARLNNDEETLLVSYQILAMAYQIDGDIAQAQQYQQLNTQLNEKIREQNRKAEQDQAERQLQVERKESEIKNLISDREKQKMSFAQAELERQKQEKELALLKREQELQQNQIKTQNLEKESIRQLLEITQQKALADEQKQEIEKQKLLAEKGKIEKERSDLEKRQAESEKKQTQELAKKEREAREKDAQQDQKLRYYGFGVIVLVFIAAIIFLVAFINSRKTARQLQTQNKIIEEKGMRIEQQSSEILAQNEELFQNQEEIMAQKEYIEKKNNDLEARSLQISKSIKAANIIQRAILPHKEKLDELLKNYFIIYRPKDVVSGDFYWLNKIQNTTIFIAADCTGHGVPGAFMTLIGNTLLDKIIRVWGITLPAEILLRLNDEVRIVLRQEETKNFTDGMDMVIVSMKNIENEQVHISFAGAKNNLYYCSTKDNQVQNIKGSRKSIGGRQNDKTAYENHEITLPVGSAIYVGSDGLQDQNDMARMRFSEKRLIDVLQENCQLPLSIQQENIENTLDEYMANTDQRDDILWVGIKL